MEVELTKALKKKVEERKKGEELEEKENKKEKENLKKEKETEDKKIDSKVELLTYILKWAKDFSSKKEFKKALKIIDDDSIIIFYSGWAEIGSNKEDVGCWSRVYLYNNGNLEYKDGYKWMGFRKSFYLNKSVINKIRYSYLKEFFDEIISKKIYKTIKREIEEA